MKFTFRDSMRYVLLTYLLVFGLLTAFAEKTSFYEKEEKKELRGVSSESSFLSRRQGSQSDSEFDLYEGSVLKAPPGGGDPIGGVSSVSDGVWFLCILALEYACFRYWRHIRNKAKASHKMFRNFSDTYKAS